MSRHNKDTLNTIAKFIPTTNLRSVCIAHHTLPRLTLRCLPYTWLPSELTHTHLTHLSFNPCIENQHAQLEFACRKGYLAIVNRILLHNRVDPSADDNDAIRSASYNGHGDVVKRLLLDERVDPSADDNWAIRFASYNGHGDIVKRLLLDKRVDPSADDNAAIRWAANNGHLSVVKRLLQDERVDPSDDDNAAIRWAANNGRRTVVKRLLQDERVNRLHPVVKHVCHKYNL